MTNTGELLLLRVLRTLIPVKSMRNLNSALRDPFLGYFAALQSYLRVRRTVIGRNIPVVLHLLKNPILPQKLIVLVGPR